MKNIEVSNLLKGLVGTEKRVDIRPGCPWQHRVDKCYASWSKFHASPGTWSPQDVVSLLTFLIDRAFTK